MKVTIKHLKPRNESDRNFKAEAFIDKVQREGVINIYGTEYLIKITDRIKTGE